MIYNDSIKTNLEWLASLDTEKELSSVMRRTSIIATIGPKTNNVKMMNDLRSVGMNMVRMNFSHGSHEYHLSVIENARKAEKEQSGRPLAIALDTKGPEIRTGDTIDGSDIPISIGHEMTISTNDQYATKCDDKVMYVDYKNICKVIEAGRVIYVDDGNLSFQVKQVVDDKTLKVVCLNNGKISSRKGVNLPKTDVDLPALSEKDIGDLRFGVEHGVDMIFASFIRRGEDVVHIRKVLGDDGAHIKIISKIENQQGVNNFDDILKHTDGVMVARGDLGIEIPAPAVFVAQKMMIAKCNLAGKPVICATQMLESMTNNPRPTRAEVSDVGNSVLDGTDCVMLSGETAKGSYPVESVRYMAEICLQAETSIAYGPLYNELRLLAEKPLDTTETTCCSAINAAIEREAKAIICLSTSGVTARLCSKYRPSCPIIMVTREPGNARQAHLYRGVYPLLYPYPKPAGEGIEWQRDVDRRMAWGIKQSIGLGVLKPNDPIVVIQGWTKGSGHTSMLRIEEAVDN